ncbi:MAG: hypothetical protein KF861_23690, partial [Planctomycetaceae bacterium]|nr:hypothetical protein [Planctomycetaceae bacterium]
DRVLLVGLGSTATLSTCLACPVREVTCVEADNDLLRMSDEVIAPASGVNPLEDDRVTLLSADPTLALLAGGDRYDVVILSDAQPYLLSQTSRFTREFYRQVDRHLSPGGIVCQRLQYADFGRRPIENALGTLRSVFPQVVCLESAPGEMLLLASNSQTSLFDEGLLKRCEASHIRRLLAQIGWDWSVVMNLAAISSESVSVLCKGPIAVNTVGNGHAAYHLPREVMRCEPKWREVQSLMAERGSRMLAWVDAPAEVQAVTQRLDDMTQQQKLIVENPDQYWAYRNTLKERLKERPRSQILPVKNELQRTRHPEDQRRMDYLEALGAAATHDAPNPVAIARLTTFAEPYDPLVSYFLHEEAARLYARAAEKDERVQFDHLRYSVYFGPAQDRSVQNVAAAIQLLIANPELIADPQERWDEFNSLLDVLRQRSQLRVHADKTASAFELADAEQSIRTAERAMKVMEGFREQANVDQADWTQRRTVLERMLIRPMWTYHAKQAQRLAAIDARKHVTAENKDDAARTE